MNRQQENRLREFRRDAEETASSRRAEPATVPQFEPDAFLSADLGISRDGGSFRSGGKQHDHMEAALDRALKKAG